MLWNCSRSGGHPCRQQTLLDSTDVQLQSYELPASRLKPNYAEQWACAQDILHSLLQIILKWLVQLGTADICLMTPAHFCKASVCQRAAVQASVTLMHMLNKSKTATNVTEHSRHYRKMSITGLEGRGQQ